jgi:putative molybdopterin biosynthesis protein
MKDVYLHDIPLDQARARFAQALAEAGLSGRLSVERIPLDEKAVGRVLAEPVWARISSPHYHAAAMDGFALRAADTAGATPSSPVTIALGGTAQYVDTGDPLPAWSNAVVPIEETEPLDQSGNPDKSRRNPAAIRLRAALPPWKHVRAMGEDMVASELVLPAGHVLRPVDLGACAGSGSTSLQVATRPRVAIIPSGSELKPVGAPVEPGDIIEYNSIMLAAQVREWGGIPERMPIVPDEFERICAAVTEAAQAAELVLLLSGSSAGSEDFSAAVVEQLGSLLVHGIAVRPGHPVILGMLAQSKAAHAVPIIGVPGYPVSAVLTGEIFVGPLLSRWTGRPESSRPTLQAEITRKITSPLGDDDYVRVAVAEVGDRTLAAPIARGAGVISSMVRADGIVVIPAGQQGLPAGAPVEVRLYSQPADVRRTILAVGSHDMILDLLSQHLTARDRRLASANVGSLGGLMALKRGEAHLAGSHLLDPGSGEYNLAYIRKYLPGRKIVLLGLVGREQGLMVQAGNPKKVLAFEDLARPDVRFVNRQRGAGTRLLLDFEIERRGIAPESVQGYGYEEYTHLNVAAAVASGRVDAGLGIPAAAQALGLDFVPLAKERYDLLIPAEYYGSELLSPLLEELQTQEFQKAVASLPGYDIGPMGKVISIVE